MVRVISKPLRALERAALIGLLLLPTAAVSQQTDALRAISGMVNEANRKIIEMQKAIDDTEAALSAWETELQRSTITGRNATIRQAGSPVIVPDVARDIADHPLVLEADRGCQDEFTAVAVPNLARGDAQTKQRLVTCARNIVPRVRFELPIECSNLFWVMNPDGRLTLDGHVKDAVDAEELKAKFGAATVANVIERPFPVCSALEALELPLSSKDRPKIRMLSNKTRIAFEESLAFEIETPDFYSFFYLAYLQANGAVVNLAPRRSLIREQHPPSTVLRFGDGRDGRQTYTASAPAGTEAIIGIASRSPIDALEALERGATGAFDRDVDHALYLQLLRESLEDEYSLSRGRREISAEVLHLTVVP